MTARVTSSPSPWMDTAARDYRPIRGRKYFGLAFTKAELHWEVAQRGDGLNGAAGQTTWHYMAQPNRNVTEQSAV